MHSSWGHHANHASHGLPLVTNTLFSGPCLRLAASELASALQRTPCPNGILPLRFIAWLQGRLVACT